MIDQAVQTRALDVDQRREPGAAADCRFHRLEQIDRFAALAEPDDQAAFVQEIGQIAELGPDDAVGLAAGDAREEVLAAARGVGRRPAADEVDGAGLLDLVGQALRLRPASAASRRSTTGCSRISLAM